MDTHSDGHILTDGGQVKMRGESANSSSDNV